MAGWQARVEYMYKQCRNANSGKVFDKTSESTTSIILAECWKD